MPEKNTTALQSTTRSQLARAHKAARKKKKKINEKKKEEVVEKKGVKVVLGTTGRERCTLASGFKNAVIFMHICLDT